MHDWPEGVEVRVRIGIHTGEAAAAGSGTSASRSTARPGSALPLTAARCCVSDSTRTLVEDDLPEGVFLRDLGSYRLKDIDRPERISQLVAEGLQVGVSAAAGGGAGQAAAPSCGAVRCWPRRWPA